MLARKADGERHPLSWQFAHIASGVNWWMHHVMKDGRGLIDDYPAEKDAIADKLTASRDRLLGFFAAGDGQAMDQTYTMPKEKRPEGGLTQGSAASACCT